MVDLAFLILKAANTPFYYRDLMHEIAKIKELNEQEMMNVIAQLYTEINIDGRFACVGTNLWGLKRWYPVEKAEDAMGNTKRPRIINDDDDDLDDEDIFAEEEDTYVEEEDYDALDEDRLDLFEDEDDAEEVDEDILDPDLNETEEGEEIDDADGELEEDDFELGDDSDDDDDDK